MKSLRSCRLLGLVALLGGIASPSISSAQGETLGLPPATPEAAAQWRSLSFRDERGLIEPDGWKVASDQFVANQRAQMRSGGYRTFFPTAQGYQWQQRGPANTAGRFRSIVADPNDTDRIWAGSVTGGVWHSTDAGMHWTNQFEDQRTKWIGSLAMDPTDANVIYAGTGEGYFSTVGRPEEDLFAADSRRGEGILVTRDGGVSWEPLPSTSSWGYVNRIQVAPGDRDRILASTRSPGGVWLSTDRGGSWTQVISAEAGFDVEFDPADASKALATTLDTDGEGHTVHFSTDGGATWSPVTGSLAQIDGRLKRTELAIAPTMPSVVYASVAGEGTSEVHISNDGGQSWTDVTQASPITDASFHSNTIHVHPNDHEQVAVGGWWVYRSHDSGSSFRHEIYLNGTMGPYFHDFVMLPSSAQDANPAVYIVSEEGVFLERGLWLPWYGLPYTQTRSNGLITGAFNSVAGIGNTDYILGGVDIRGTRKLIGRSRYSSGSTGGYGGPLSIDHQNRIYDVVSTQYGSIFRRLNGRLTRISDPIEDGGDPERINFHAPLAMPPTEGSTLFVGARRLWRTQNFRDDEPTWSVVREGDANTSAVVVANRDSRVVYTAQNDGKIYRTLNGRDANPTWVVIDDNGAKNPLPDRFVTRIVVHPRHSSRLFVMFGGFEPDNLWKSKDFGETWEQVTGTGEFTLPSAPIRGLAWDPRNSLHLHVATEVGVYHSFDGGQTWNATLDGPSLVPVNDIVFMMNSHRLLAATDGRGLWTLETGTFEPGVVWRKTDGDLEAWPLLGGELDQSYPVDLPPNSTVHRADLNGDEWDDLIVYDPATQTHVAIQLRAGQVIATTTLRTGSDWVLDSVRDMDFDGKDDLFWRRTTDDTIVAWLMNGHAAKAQTSYGPRPNGLIRFTTDPIGHVGTDIDMVYPSGRRHRWLLSALTRWDDRWWSAPANSWSHSLRVRGGRFDLHHVESTGMFRTARLWGFFPNRQVVGVSDMDSDDTDDVVLYDASDGRIHVWLVANESFRKATGSPGVAPDSKVVMNDFDDDGIDDLFIWNQVTGEVSIWFMDGMEAREKRSLGTMSPETYDDVMVGSW